MSLLTLAKRRAAGQREGSTALIHVSDIKMDERSQQDLGVKTKAGKCTLDPF